MATIPTTLKASAPDSRHLTVNSDFGIGIPISVVVDFVDLADLPGVEDLTVTLRTLMRLKAVGTTYPAFVQSFSASPVVSA